MRRRDPLPLVAVAGGVLLYSTLPVFVQASSLSGPMFSFWRLVLAVPVVLVAAMLFVRLSHRPRTAWAGWRWTVFAGLSLGANQLFFMSAIKATSVADATLIGTLAPVLVGMYAAAFQGERLGWAFWCWSVLAIVGAGIVVLAGVQGTNAEPAGMGLAGLAVIAFSAFILFAKQGRGDIHLVLFLCGATMAAAVLVTVYVALTEQTIPWLSTRDLLLVLGVVLGAGTVGHLLFTWPMRWLSASIPAVMKLAQPVLAAVLAWWWLGEILTRGHFIGGTLTLVSVAGAIFSASAGRRRGTDAIEDSMPAV